MTAPPPVGTLDGMRIVIDNRQRRFRVNQPALRRVAAALAACAAAQRPDTPWREVTLILVDDEAMEPFNRRVMGHGGTTDAITQRYVPLPGEPAGLVGELIVNVARAWQVGRGRRGWSPSRELALYVAHGCDHLNDEDDATPAGRRRMRRRELRWLSGLRLPSLLAPRQFGR